MKPSTKTQSRYPKRSRSPVYLKVFNIGLQNTFVYRWNFIFRSIFQLFPLVGTVFLWRAIYGEKDSSTAGFDFGSIIFYFLLVLFLDNLIAPTDDEWQVSTDIREGQINSFLVKPVNYLVYRFSLFASNRLLFTGVTLPIVILAFAAFHQYLRWPAHWETWPLTLLSVGLAALLQFAIAFGVALLAFWMLEISTVVFIIYSFEYFLSGHLFPLSFMPAFLQDILFWSPFPYELYVPIAIFMEKLQGTALWQALAMQAFWAAFGLGCAQWLWNLGLSKYQAVGG